MKTKYTEFAEGQVIHWTAAGKIARSEGSSGTEVSGVIVEVRNDDNMLRVMPSHRKDPSSPFFNMHSVVGFNQVLKLYEIVPLGSATYAELQLAAKHIGASADIVEAAKPTNDQVAVMISLLRAGGYDRIQIDPKRRIKNPKQLIDFDVALPVRRQPKVHTLSVQRDLAMIDKGKAFLKKCGLNADELLKEEKGSLLKYSVKVPKADRLDLVIKAMRKAFGKPHILNTLSGVKQYRWNIPEHTGVFQLSITKDLEKGTIQKLIAMLMA